MKNVLKILFFGSITLLFVRCTLSTSISSQYDDVLNIERHRYDATFNSFAGPNLITSEIKSYKLAALKRMILQQNRQ